MFLEKVTEHIEKLFTFKLLSELIIEYSILTFGSLLILLIGYLIARNLKNLIKKICKRVDIDSITSSFLANLVYTVILIVTIISALNNLGVQTTSLAAILGAFSVAVGLAFQNSLSNFSAGLLILFLRPFQKGDFIECAGVCGLVRGIDTLVIKLNTRDNKIITVPNSMVISNVIVNHTAEKTRRMDFEFGISYDTDITLAKNILKKLVKEEKGFLVEPDAKIYVSELAESAVMIKVKPWVVTASYWDIYRKFIENVKEKFDEEGVDMSFPTQEIILRKSDKKL